MIPSQVEYVVDQRRPLVFEVTCLAMVLWQFPGVIKRKLVFMVLELGLVRIQESDVVVADERDKVCNEVSRLRFRLI